VAATGRKKEKQQFTCATSTECIPCPVQKNKEQSTCARNKRKNGFSRVVTPVQTLHPLLLQQ